MRTKLGRVVGWDVRPEDRCTAEFEDADGVFRCNKKAGHGNGANNQYGKHHCVDNLVSVQWTNFFSKTQSQ